MFKLFVRFTFNKEIKTPLIFHFYILNYSLQNISFTNLPHFPMHL